MFRISVPAVSVLLALPPTMGTMSSIASDSIVVIASYYLSKSYTGRGVQILNSYVIINIHLPSGLLLFEALIFCGIKCFFMFGVFKRSSV